ncbi:hypothetical protein L933_02790 [Helicobacter pylori PZ5056]|uniref:Uncharacterized protein n=1 Tax=Helicobacter pylori PZ5056 TaxID=1337393 RepID=T2T174_HELPX|nr:hypothetical protein L933_02790 [Helicobacter pylori PZ5056]
MLAFHFFSGFQTTGFLILFCATHFSRGGVHLEAELSN